MAGCGWSIRMFEANDYSDEATIDHMDNFTKGKSRQLDTIRTYSGMYGIDNYLIWNLHKDLPGYDFSTMALDLSLYMYKSTDLVYFQEFYRIQDIRYNANKSQYTIYAISETAVRLHSKLINRGVTSLSYKENRTPKEVLKEIIEKNNIFKVNFHDDALSTKNMIHYQYRYFDIDPEWTVLDLIEYIADDNKYEWCVTTFVDRETNIPSFFLHIGHELKADKYMNATKKFNIEDDNISDSVYTMKITTNGSPMQPLASWEENLRCLWSKHIVGRGGADNSKGCFTPIGMGHFDKILYLRTLEGEIEKYNGFSMLNRRKIRIPSVGIGNILKDEGDNFIDQISIQKNPETYSIREPHNILINRGEDILVQHQLEKITRSTPYLDHNAGMLYPSPMLNEDEPPPNSLIFNVDGKRESAVLGPYVYGDGRIERDEDGNPTGNPKLIIPFKEKKGDLRLQLPNGWCLYVDEEGNTQILTRDTDPTTKPDIGAQPSQEAIQIITKKEGVPSEIRLFCEADNYITMIGPLNGTNNLTNISNSGEVWIKGGISIKLTTGNIIQNYIVIGVTGEGNPGIKILTVGTDPITIESESGTININTGGAINVGASASAVNIAGGANALAHKTHSHIGAPATDGLFKIPLIGSVANNLTGTTKTKAD